MTDRQYNAIDRMLAGQVIALCRWIDSSKANQAAIKRAVADAPDGVSASAYRLIGAQERNIEGLAGIVKSQTEVLRELLRAQQDGPARKVRLADYKGKRVQLKRAYRNRGDVLFAEGTEMLCIGDHRGTLTLEDLHNKACHLSDVPPEFVDIVPSETQRRFAS